jgi:MATE family multidrug resistance protein
MKPLWNRWNHEGGYRQVFVIAFPLILSTGAMTIQHFVDRVFLSWYSTEAIAAAMPAGILNFTIMSFFIGTASYVSTFIAQYYGAGQYHRIGSILWQGLYVSLFGGLVLFLLIPFARPIFAIVGHDTLVQFYEIEYFQILCIGGFPGIASATISGFFSGRGKPWPVMWVNTISTAANLGFDYILIFGKLGFPEMGIKGAGIATVVASIISLFVYVVIISSKIHRAKYRTLKAWKPDKKLLLRLLRFGVPSGLQFLLDMTGFTVFILLVGRLGTVSLAATNIAFNINSLAFMPMIGAGIAVSVLVGQYLGKNEPRLAQYSVYSGFHMTFLYMLSIAAAYVIIPDLFIMPFITKTDPEGFVEIHRLIVVLLRFVAVYSIFDTMNIIFASAIKGAGDTRFVMFMIMILTPFILIIPTYIAVVIFKFGLMISWLIASAYVISLGLAFFFRFLGGKWKTMRVIESAN